MLISEFGELTNGRDKERLSLQLEIIIKILYKQASIVRYFENYEFLKWTEGFDQSTILSFLDKKTNSLPKIRSRDFFSLSVVFSYDLDEEYDLYIEHGNSNFDIFSIYLCNFFMLKALKDEFVKGADYYRIFNDKEAFSNICKNAKEQNVPDAVRLWRNKVAAHPVATGAGKKDNYSTIFDSLNTSPVLVNGRYEVGNSYFQRNHEDTNIPAWSITRVFEDLQNFWYDKRLPPLLMEISDKSDYYTFS